MTPPPKTPKNIVLYGNISTFLNSLHNYFCRQTKHYPHQKSVQIVWVCFFDTPLIFLSAYSRQVGWVDGGLFSWAKKRFFLLFTLLNNVPNLAKEGDGGATVYFSVKIYKIIQRIQPILSFYNGFP